MVIVGRYINTCIRWIRIVDLNRDMIRHIHAIYLIFIFVVYQYQLDVVI